MLVSLWWRVSGVLPLLNCVELEIDFIAQGVSYLFIQSFILYRIVKDSGFGAEF